jgi:hypothetical protein
MEDFTGLGVDRGQEWRGILEFDGVGEISSAGND